MINSDGSIIGAIEVVKDSASINEMIQTQVNRILVFSLVFTIIVGFGVSILARGMVLRMERIGRFLQRLIDGKLDHTPHANNLKINDELGDIYRNCVQVQETFKHMVSEIRTSCDNLKLKADSFLEIAQDTTQAADIVRVAVEEIANGARNQADSTVSANGNMTKMSGQIHLITKEVDSMEESGRNTYYFKGSIRGCGHVSSEYR